MPILFLNSCVNFTCPTLFNTKPTKFVGSPRFHSVPGSPLIGSYMIYGCDCIGLGGRQFNESVLKKFTIEAGEEASTHE